MTPDRTAAAIEAPRRATDQKLLQVRDAIASIRHHKAPVTYPAVASRAGNAAAPRLPIKSVPPPKRQQSAADGC
jgi:hypothetical protein